MEGKNEKGSRIMITMAENFGGEKLERDSMRVKIILAVLFLFYTYVYVCVTHSRETMDTGWYT